MTLTTTGDRPVPKTVTQAGFSGVDTLTYLSKAALDHQSQFDNKHDFKDIFSCKVVELNQKNYFDIKIIFIMALFEKLLRMEDVALFLDRLSVYSGKTGLSTIYVRQDIRDVPIPKSSTRSPG